MLDLFSIAGVFLVFAVSSSVTFAATPVIAKITARFGIMGRDVHKTLDVKIPEMCGLAILLGLTIGTFIYAVWSPVSARTATAFLGTVLLAGAIGVSDDLRPLNARVKPLLTAVACVPILVLQEYDPLPVIPLIGHVRLTVVYPLLIPIAIAVTANAVNMMEVMNGAMAGSTAVISFAILLVLLAASEIDAAALAAGLLGSVLAFYYYNRYPAKVFPGDAGSLAVGAALGAISIVGRIETVMIVAMIPHIMNAFYGLASVGRLYERREVPQRPVRLRQDGKLEASRERGAPVTLARLILAEGPLGEREIVRGMIFLTVVSSALAIITYGIMVIKI